ncbi:MAG TPA: NAD-dependent epimerase/dehydratase family protein [Pseudomonadales bacterium]|nr:NAD-dependent epimerase/dehydratase family protein [Pseudomonadales bacterium]
MNILVIGGAGVTGTVIVKQLLTHGHDVAILHRGLHAASLPDNVTRIQADPYAKDGLTAALTGKQFDVVIATYGRLRYVAQQLIGVTPRLISVGGAAPVYKGWGEMMAANPWETTQPTPLFLSEDHALASAETADPFSMAVRKTEQDVLGFHQAGHFNVTHFRYPLVYGPNNICPAEWGLIRRAREKRTPLILPAGGLTLVSRGFADNIAHAIVLAVENPTASAGQIYNICDEHVIYNQEWVTRLGEIMNHRFDTIDMPFSALPSGFRATPPQLLYRHHCVLDINKIKQQLGYRDVVSVEEALERTVKYYMDNPLADGNEAEQNLGDPFDYVYEDAFIAAWKKHGEDFVAARDALPAPKVVWKHPYQQTTKK